jgi:DNA-binding XRE family transcriptional regulator
MLPTHSGRVPKPPFRDRGLLPLHAGRAGGYRLDKGCMCRNKLVQLHTYIVTVNIYLYKVQIKPIQIRMARAALGIGVRELAKMTGVTANTISRIENGADAGHMDASDLIRALPHTLARSGPSTYGSRKEKARSSGHGSHAALSPPTRFAFSFMRSPIISATSCEPWRRRSRSRTGR